MVADMQFYTFSQYYAKQQTANERNQLTNESKLAKLKSV